MASMRLGLLRAQARGARRPQIASAAGFASTDWPPNSRRSLERQRPLPAAGQFAIDLDQDFRVEQRPVPDAL